MGAIVNFYNTTALTGDSLMDAVKQANNQAQIIMCIFRNRKTRKATPSQVQRFYNQLTRTQTPITSIRRAISDLTSNGRLIKTGQKTKGPYGSQEHIWRLKD